MVNALSPYAPAPNLEREKRWFFFPPPPPDRYQPRRVDNAPGMSGSQRATPIVLTVMKPSLPTLRSSDTAPLLRSRSWLIVHRPYARMH